MSIVVTGATGHLGRLVIERAAGEGPGRADHRRRPQRGEGRRTSPPAASSSRVADYSAPETFAGAFARRRQGAADLRQRGRPSAWPSTPAVIDAAKAAGVALLAYTSVLGRP